MSLVVRKPIFGVSDTNQAVQLQKMAINTVPEGGSVNMRGPEKFVP